MSPWREQLARVRRRVLGRDLAEMPREQGVALGQQGALLREQIDQQQRQRVAVGTLMAHQIAGSATSCNEAEFSAFSQFGEDGIIEYLIQRCDIAPQTFVEIGVETYAEANTRFLAEHRLWRGLIVDQNPRLSEDLERTRLEWRSRVAAFSTFVTRDNVRALVDGYVGSDGLGLLSIDIDGVDYWVLEQLVTLDAALVVVEYNALFGDTAAVAVPYEPAFDRRRPEYHNIYYGASLAAYDHLLAAHGYSLVACVTAGNNAFFVRSDRLGDVAARTVAQAFRPRRFGEHRDLDGQLTGIVEPRGQLHDIRNLPLVDVTDGHTGTLAEILA